MKHRTFAATFIKLMLLIYFYELIFLELGFVFNFLFSISYVCMLFFVIHFD